MILVKVHDAPPNLRNSLGQFQFTPLREGRHDAHQPEERGQQDFNSRPSARGDHHLITLGQRPRHFNSRPSARGDTAAHIKRRRISYFNSRPSARGDMASVSYLPSDQFQFTPLREGRLFVLKNRAMVEVFQFTPLREGRLRSASPFASLPPISIHAPPRGATGRWQRLRQGHCLFQFTPLREGRRSR